MPRRNRKRPAHRPVSSRAIKPRLGMTGDELRLWRKQRPGEHKIGNGGRAPGWTQRRCADWYGVDLRTWQAYEYSEHTVGRRLVLRMLAYETSLESVVDRIFDVSEAQLDHDGSPFPRLRHEFKGTEDADQITAVEDEA